jgi:uncharacterized protein DUF5681
MDKVTNKIQTSAPEDTGHKQDTRFKPGQSGNLAGRPKGARSRLGEKFIETLAADFEEHGEEVIEKVRSRDPVQYTKIISSILPREVLIKAFTATATIDLTAIEAAQGRLQAYKYARDFLGAPLIDAQPDEGAVITPAWRADDD